VTKQLFTKITLSTVVGVAMLLVTQTSFAGYWQVRCWRNAYGQRWCQRYYYPGPYWGSPPRRYNGPYLGRRCRVYRGPYGSVYRRCYSR